MNLQQHSKVIVYCTGCFMPDMVESVLESGVSEDALIEGLCEPEELREELCAGAAVVYCKGSHKAVFDAIAECGLSGVVRTIEFTGANFDPLHRQGDLMVDFEHALQEECV